MWRTHDPDRFVVGVNLPWVGYGTDVGTSAWFTSGGVSQRPETLERLDRTFETLARDGMKVARTFLLCDARSGVVFDAGMPTGLDATVLADIAAFASAARRHGVGLLPVLLDFHLCGALELVNGVQLGGRSHLIANPAAAAALIDRVLRPIAEMFAHEDAIVAWDVMNEPEWCLRRGMFPPSTQVSFEAMRAFLGAAVETLHRTALQPVTVGSAGPWALDLVTGIDLDFYQVHWYDRFGWDALARPVAELGLADRPVILGEFSGRTTRLPDVLETARRSGYEAALVWSVLAEDEHSAYPPQLAEWLRAH
jgi:hypothetical protein